MAEEVSFPIPTPPCVRARFPSHYGLGTKKIHPAICEPVPHETSQFCDLQALSAATNSQSIPVDLLEAAFECRLGFGLLSLISGTNMMQRGD